MKALKNNDILFFYPYNFSFNEEIKFGGYYEISRNFFITIQSVMNENLENENHFTFIIYILNKLNLSIKDIVSFYFYRNVNKNHNLTIEDIAKKQNKMHLKNTVNNLSFMHEENKINFDFDFSNLRRIPKYFLLQIFDRILSMFFYKDIEKFQIIQVLRNV